jgi:hypothetical protein
MSEEEQLTPGVHGGCGYGFCPVPGMGMWECRAERHSAPRSDPSKRYSHLISEEAQLRGLAKPLGRNIGQRLDALQNGLPLASGKSMLATRALIMGRWRQVKRLPPRKQKLHLTSRRALR